MDVPVGSCERAVGITDLPPHVLALVFEHLADVADLARCALVAPSWSETVRSGIWPRAKRLQLRSQGDGAAGVLPWAADRCAALAEVNASGCAALTDQELAPLASLPLASLNLARCWNFEGYELLGALARRGTLRRVDLSDTALQIDALAAALPVASGGTDAGGPAADAAADDAAAAFADAAAGGAGGRIWAEAWAEALDRGVAASVVTHLSLSHIGIENEYGLREIPWVGPALVSLDLSRNVWLATHHAYGLLGGAAARITQLRELCLADCPRLQSIPCVDALTTLTRLDVSRTAVSGGCLVSVAKRCRRLTSLAVSGCHNLTATGLETAAYSLRLTRLEADDLPGAGDGVAAIVANMPLSAAGASSGNPTTASAGAHLFEVSACCGGLTDATLGEVAQYLRLLADMGDSAAAAASAAAEAAAATAEVRDARSAAAAASAAAEARDAAPAAAAAATASIPAPATAEARGAAPAAEAAAATASTPALATADAFDAAPADMGDRAAAAAAPALATADAFDAAPADMGDRAAAAAAPATAEARGAAPEAGEAAAAADTAAPPASAAGAAAPAAGLADAAAADAAEVLPQEAADAVAAAAAAAGPAAATEAAIDAVAESALAAAAAAAEATGSAAAGAHMAAAARVITEMSLRRRQPTGFAVLRVAGCARLGRRGLSALAEVGALDNLRELDVSHLDGLWAKPAGVLCEIAVAAGRHLTSLRADGCSVSDAVLAAVGAHCGNLGTLSLVGCRGVTDAGLAAISAGCPRLSDLAVGGGSALLWREDASLPAFTAVTSLRLARRNHLQDVRLVAALEALPQLGSLTLAACADITDRSLQALPLRLSHLHLSACERLSGDGLARLSRLRSLRLSGCPSITEPAVQAVSVACRQLQVLELPSDMAVSCLPAQCADSSGQLRGVKVEGGRQRNTHWLRRRHPARTHAAAA